ncbi:uncharacterized protein ColSpa_11121 [Colletotrichum spaethianum]|uniref:Uncharacterized protein n=1 Tax=Colletotrichum spaethianum TaxID=700344 RepID=A0AA37UPM0_9PEZI|nr:uncharacterized protein ColSpa_11121 [Colletotrichum spaethianum]GKT50940.1 hypothetical protein ColSpa_11121 [Colletotrichum spaethianum]
MHHDLLWTELWAALTLGSSQLLEPLLEQPLKRLSSTADGQERLAETAFERPGLDAADILVEKFDVSGPGSRLKLAGIPEGEKDEAAADTGPGVCPANDLLRPEEP